MVYQLHICISFDFDFDFGDNNGYKIVFVRRRDGESLNEVFFWFDLVQRGKRLNSCYEEHIDEFGGVCFSMEGLGVEGDLFGVVGCLSEEGDPIMINVLVDTYQM